MNPIEILEATGTKIIDQAALKYNGTWRGINFEIVNWDRWIDNKEKTEFFHQPHWNYYIFLHLAAIPDKYNPDSFWLEDIIEEMTEGSGKYWTLHRYYEHHIIGIIPLHGGITWYSKETQLEPKCNRVIKIGCDYAHLYDREQFDRGHVIKFNEVLKDVLESIDVIREEIMPDYKYHCKVVGSWWDKSEGAIQKDESFISYKGKQYLENERKDNAPTPSNN